MENIRSPYQSALLDPKKRQIRLLHLQPARDGQLIAGNLTVCSLDDPNRPLYEALSYFWSDPSPAFEICLGLVDKLPIAKNVGLALQDLRLESQIRVMWIDAICIDQNSIEEKNHQVRMMGAIYSSATKVCAWIDAEVDVSLAVFESRFLSEASEHWESKATWDSLSTILGNKYWSRVWIQQELILAKSFQLHCRKFIITDTELQQLAGVMRKRKGRPTSISEYDARIFLRQYNFIFEMGVFHTVLSKPEHSQIRSIFNIMQRNDLKPNIDSPIRMSSLLYLLHHTRELEATCRHDKIFALCALSIDYSDGDLLIDYAVSASQTFVSVVTFVLKKYRSLDFLCVTCMPLLWPFEGDLPSWTPNWGRTRLNTPTIFNASKDLGPLQDAVSADSKILRAQGIQIDVIHSICSPLPKVYTIAMLYNARWTLFKEAICTLVAATMSKLNYGGVEEYPAEILEACRQAWKQYLCTLAYLKSVPGHPRLEMYDLARGIDVIRNLILRDDISEAPLWRLQEMQPFKDLSTELQKVALSVGEILEAKNIVVFNQGSVGLSLDIIPWEKDELWILFGCSMPVIVRPIANGQYAFVSPVYVDGLMDGEGVEGVSGELKDGDVVNRFSVQTIDLV